MENLVLNTIVKKISDSNLPLYVYTDTNKSTIKEFGLITDSDIVVGATSFQVFDFNIKKSYCEYEKINLTKDDELIGCSLRNISSNEYRLITGYNENTGTITIDSGFSNTIYASGSGLNISVSDSLFVYQLNTTQSGGNQSYDELTRYVFKLYTKNDSNRNKANYYQSELMRLFLSDSILIKEETNGIIYIDEGLTWNPPMDNLSEVSQISSGSLRTKEIKSR